MTAPLCLHTITTKPWSTEECIQHYSAAGVQGITFWRYNLEGRAPATVGRQAREAGLQIVSLCRGGFFPARSEADLQKAIDDNLHCIDQAAELGAPLIVLVCGAIPGQALTESRKQITEGISKCLAHAQAAGITLAIEPLHPMYADDRSAVNTMRQAHEICDALGSPSHLGIAADVYHIWWDPELAAMLQLAGEKGRLSAYHICDWRTPTADLLNDRGLMGEGCIPLREIAGHVASAGFTGMHEVEIFSTRWWAADQHEYLRAILKAYQKI
jgi:sugar phosphate isomerase/epimerase